ncbi:MAG: ATP-binding cassette domain-containing protein [Coriobacteriales bacterium]|nr:ATP-binding cassette domain-containing protein [Coriobacteriales bacterium]
MLILRTYELTKQYRHETAVDSVNMTINRGDIYGLIGKNGAGKTTLMKLISGLASPTSGKIELFGSTNLTEQRAKIGCLIETPALYDHMTAIQNLNMIKTILKTTIRFDVNEVLDIVGLKDVGKKKVSKFSLGMKQRLGVALALMGSPEFLILDEPINGLDPLGIKELRELLLKLNKEFGLTILISSHILSELFKLASCYGIIANGKLVAEITQQEVENNSFNEKSMEESLLKLMEVS